MFNGTVSSSWAASGAKSDRPSTMKCTAHQISLLLVLKTASFVGCFRGQSVIVTSSCCGHYHCHQSSRRSRRRHPCRLPLLSISVVVVVVVVRHCVAVVCLRRRGGGGVTVTVTVTVTPAPSCCRLSSSCRRRCGVVIVRRGSLSVSSESQPQSLSHSLSHFPSKLRKLPSFLPSFFPSFLSRKRQSSLTHPLTHPHSLCAVHSQ